MIDRSSFVYLAFAVAIQMCIATACHANRSINIPPPSAPQTPEPLRRAFNSSGEERRALFEALLRDNDAHVRIMAAQNLSNLPSTRSIASLIDSLRDGDIFVRAASQEALFQIGPPAVETLLARLAVKDDPYRTTIATTLLALLSRNSDMQQVPDSQTNAVLASTRFARCFGTLCIQRVGFPKYPPLAKQARISGKVSLEFSVKSGMASEIKAAGHPLLVGAGMDALKQCVFADSSEKGERYTLIVEFEVVGSPQEPGSAAFDFVLPNYIRTVVRPPEVMYSTAQPAAGADR